MTGIFRKSDGGLVAALPSRRYASALMKWWNRSCCIEFGGWPMVLALLATSGCQLAHNYSDPDGPRYAGNHASDPTETSALPHIKVVTFNIQYGERYARAHEELSATPDLSGADIILLQEMDAPGTEAIAAALERDYVYYPGSVQRGRDFGNAVLSRWPIVEDQKLILPHKNPVDGRQRIAVRAVIETPIGTLEAFSVHNETPWLGPRARLEQARAVLNVARRAPAWAIIAGDFNTGDPGSLDATVELYAQQGFAWVSYHGGGGLGTLDNTFARQTTSLASGSVATNASDHEPQWVRLELLH